MTISTDTPILFLHGLGESADAWTEVIEHLGVTNIQAPALGRICGTWSEFNLADAADELAEQITEPVNVCGLSLGAVLALELAIRHPEKVNSLFLSAPQVRPPQTLVAIQKILMKLLPQKIVCPPGMSKTDLLAVLDVVANIDNTESAKQISVPTTVIVGSKDRANTPSALQIANLIPGARHVVAPGVGHQWSTTQPELFAKHLAEHLENKPRFQPGLVRL